MEVFFLFVCLFIQKTDDIPKKVHLNFHHHLKILTYCVWFEQTYSNFQANLTR